MFAFPNLAFGCTFENFKKKQNIKGELVARLTIGRKFFKTAPYVYHSSLALKTLQKDEFSPELKAKFLREVMPELRKFFERDEEVYRMDMGEQDMLVERRGDDFVLHIYPRL